MNAFKGIKNALAIELVVLVAIALSLSNCGFSRGWQVNFGVSPVSSIDNNQGFQANDEDVRRVNR
jgi:hypothetical protein